MLLSSVQRYNNNHASHERKIEESSQSSTKSNLTSMIYITTHFSDQHKFYLTKCWPLALQHVPLLANSDIVVYLNPSRTETVPIAMDLLSQTFANQNLTVHTREYALYQAGAIQAVTDAAKEGWFENYDWIFRLNPDVIIRNDTFIQTTMHHNSTATALLVHCMGYGQDLAHTDFFGLKSSALPLSSMLQKNIGDNAEITFTNQIRNEVLDKGRHRWIYDARPGGDGSQCRVASDRKPHETPITHFHVEQNELEGDCPIPFSS